VGRTLPAGAPLEAEVWAAAWTDIGATRVSEAARKIMIRVIHDALGQ
jgi:hypothetical protein